MQPSIAALFRAIESRDLRKIAPCMHPDIQWQNIPHPPAVGRDAVMQLLGGFICWSDRVRWDVISSAADGNTAWVERIDRFWIDGREWSVRCNGVLELDPETGLLKHVRDYVDLGEWRTRIALCLDRLQGRPAIDVVRHHLSACHTADPVRMAADFAFNAVLEEGKRRHQGWNAIADYFEQVEQAQSSSASSPDSLRETDDSIVENHWEWMRNSQRVRVVDEYTVSAGRIVLMRRHYDA